MRIMVTGGAGYVGSVVTEETLKEGHEVVVLDNLQQGHKGAISHVAKLVHVDIRDPIALVKVFHERRIDAVMHMAGETVVESSMTDPRRFFIINVVGGLNLLEAMRKHGVKKNCLLLQRSSLWGTQINSHPGRPSQESCELLWGDQADVRTHPRMVWTIRQRMEAALGTMSM